MLLFLSLRLLAFAIEIAVTAHEAAHLLNRRIRRGSRGSKSASSISANILEGSITVPRACALREDDCLARITI